MNPLTKDHPLKRQQLKELLCFLKIYKDWFKRDYVPILLKHFISWKICIIFMCKKRFGISAIQANVEIGVLLIDIFTALKTTDRDIFLEVLLLSIDLQPYLKFMLQQHLGNSLVNFCKLHPFEAVVFLLEMENSTGKGSFLIEVSFWKNLFFAYLFLYNNLFFVTQ